uniref:Uncharacterized protein n=1 Tax=Candidatus Kentrum sp. TC TaxID=2126339 RepID=A0A450Z8W1_9GAMM|nr:MAG: hypothetical protein BECKTC1821D_GA0114238_109413 [Candidatus Kentron sp. TC]
MACVDMETAKFVKLTKENYGALRETIKDGDTIVFSLPRNIKALTIPFALVIGLVTKSRWYHVGIARWVGSTLCILEARASGGVGARRLSRRLGGYLVRTNHMYNKGCDNRATGQLGDTYGWLDAWATAFGFNPMFEGMHCVEYYKHVFGLSKKDETNIFEDTPVAVVEWARNATEVL